jgi:hypothetical protein
MPFSRAVALTLALVTRSAFAGDPVSPHLPPPAPSAEPRAFPRAPGDERRPLELTAQARSFTPLAAVTRSTGERGTGLGAGAGAGFRQSPYFSLGAEGSVLRFAAPHRTTWVELAATGRAYLLEAGFLDPYFELALGYAVTRASGGSPPTLLHGPSARAGGGIDFVVASTLRLGVLVGYREVVSWPAPRCTFECNPRVHGGLLAGIAVTLPLGDPL